MTRSPNGPLRVGIGGPVDAQVLRSTVGSLADWLTELENALALLFNSTARVFWPSVS
jgi:hypothetical protein